jgi:diguanylate cyclase (GGDEF)-like protein/PAS domain S-box-containing protein
MQVKQHSHDNPLVFIGVFLILIAMVLAIITVQRIHNFRSYHQKLAESTIGIVANEIVHLIDEKRRLLGLFAGYEAQRLEQLTTSPNDPTLTAKLQERLTNYFPDSVIFTLANANGDLQANDRSDLIDRICRREIIDFDAGQEQLPQIHANPRHYHYDIMVHIQRPAGYVLAVSFDTSGIVERLKNSQRPSHQLLLLDATESNQIEVTGQGNRQDVGDEIPVRLTPDMRSRILAYSSIPNTRWRLADIADKTLLPDFIGESVRQALYIFLAFLFSSAIMTWLAFRSKRLRKLAEYELLAAKGRLEYEIEERTQEFRESKELAEITLSSISDGVITTDVMGTVSALNTTAATLTGWQPESITDRPLSDVLRLTQVSSEEFIYLPANRCLTNEEIGNLNASPLELHSIDGKHRVVQLSISEITNHAGDLVGNVLVVRDITDAHRLTHRISWQATHDALTGLINRLEFENRLKQALDRSHSDRAGHVLMYLDLDQFKVVNDTCGHVAGDELLKQIADLLNQTARRNDTVARLGGDEFAILLEYCPLKQALTLAEEIRNAIRDFRFTWDDKPFALGVSIGVVGFDASFNALTQVLSAADSACYAAKDAGRNRVHLYAEDDQAIEQRFGEMQWVSRIRKALDAGDFTLYGQRIIPLNEHIVEDNHIEVLVRMRSDDGELILPGAFIPAAERYGLMIDLDRMVIEMTLTWLQETQYTGLVSINLSTQSMTDPNFLDEVFSMLCNTLTHPGQLLFEVTETAAITHLQKAQIFIERIRQLGCRFALDDFGSGMSSFGYLKHLPVDHLKIDGSFIRDLVDDPVNYAMVKAIQEVATTMQIQTVAEYVENDEILEQLKLIGIDYGQGHGIERPKPLTEIHTRMEHRVLVTPL